MNLPQVTGRRTTTETFVDLDLARVLRSPMQRAARFFRLASRVGAGDYMPLPRRRRRHLRPDGQVVLVKATSRTTGLTTAEDEGDYVRSHLGEEVPLWEELWLV